MITKYRPHRTLFNTKALLRGETGICVALMLVTLVLYSSTLLPGLGSRDTAELQRVVSTLDLAHPTGYPLYTMLGWLWKNLFIVGIPAWRISMFSAVIAATAISVIYLCARAMGQQRLIGIVVTTTFATSLTFWSQATIAEVYAMTVLIQALLILTILRWHAGRCPFWVIGLVLGMGLAHHRTIILMIPGILLFIAITRRPRLTEIGSALLALIGSCFLYLYIPLRAPEWEDPWQLLWRYISGVEMTSAWLDLGRLRTEGIARVAELGTQFILPQLTLLGSIIAVIGSAWLWRRDRAIALFLITSYILVLLFCAAYYVIDIDVFLIPAHLITALLLGEGLRCIANTLPPRMTTPITIAALLIPIVLVSRNLETVQTANTDTQEQLARSLMENPLPPDSLLVAGWALTESLYYLQAIEHQQPHLTIVSTADKATIIEQLDQEQPVYLVDPDPTLALTQSLEGAFWRVDPEPLEVTNTTDIYFEETLTLTGYTLHNNVFEAGSRIPITIEWMVQHPPHNSYTMFVHLVHEDGTLMGQQDLIPRKAPTNEWETNTAYIDILAPQMNTAAPPGRYQINIGWYDPSTMQRLHILERSGIEKGADYMTLGEVYILP